MTTASCSDLVPEAIPQDELYAREFYKKFGVADNSHTWSMARRVSARVELDCRMSGTLEVYTSHPFDDGCRRLASIPFNGNRIESAFDVEAGMKDVYVRVIDRSGMVHYAATLAISNGSVEGNDTATNADASDLTVEPMPFIAYRMLPEVVSALLTSSEFTTYTALHEEVIKEDQAADGKFNAVLTEIPNLNMLTNLRYTDGQEFYWSELKPVFESYTDFDGTEKTGVFAESIDHIEQYYHGATGSIKLDPDVTFRVLDEGPVTLECIWRGTQRYDYFGYYYYPADKALTPEDLWNIPKYVFLTPDDITESSSLTQISEWELGSKWLYWDSDKQDNVYEYFDQWGDYQNQNGMGSAYPAWKKDKTKLRGTKYSLAYFGADYGSAPSYDFPKDVHIGYFLMRDNYIFFSDCALNYYLNNLKYECNGKTGVLGDGPLERPFAAKFTYDRRTFIGFGDYTNDCDLNDVVFVTSNVYPTPEDITPEPIKKPNPEIQKWTLACEDLGAISESDFDFNDIVIDIEYEVGSGQLTLIPVAAGGTLPSELYWDDRNLGEIHSFFGVASTKVVNAYRNSTRLDGKTVTITGLLPDFSVSADFAKHFRIRTYSNNGDNEGRWIDNIQVVADGNPMPHMLLLGHGWEWPIENVSIEKAYTRFSEWVKDNDFEWNSHKNTENIFKR